MKDRARLEAIIQQYSRPEHRAFLLGSIRQSIRISPGFGRVLETGQSKFGGSPDLPLGQTWPLSKGGMVLIFLAQINLSEAANFDADALLPKEGLLSFFVSSEDFTEGSVIYSKNYSQLKPLEPPQEITKSRKTIIQRLFRMTGKNLLLEEAAIQFHQEYYLPSWDSVIIERYLQTTGLKLDAIDIFSEEFMDKDLFEDGHESDLTPNHHLLGWNNPIQSGSPELYVSGINKFQNLSLADLNLALQWKLLLQFDSDNQLNIQWGDWGMIYFYINEEDLQKQVFSNARLTWQCY